MSWSIIGIAALTVGEAKAKVAAAEQVPDPIRAYVILGIDALATRYGAEGRVSVVAQGHLSTGSDHEVTDATISVTRAAMSSHDDAISNLSVDVNRNPRSAEDIANDLGVTPSYVAERARVLGLKLK